MVVLDTVLGIIGVGGEEGKCECESMVDSSVAVEGIGDEGGMVNSSVND